MKQHFRYMTHGVCSQLIDFDLEDGIVSGVFFTGGCNGNLKAIARLVEGKKAGEISEILKGNLCGNKGTSCADQLSKALVEAMEYAKKNA